MSHTATLRFAASEFGPSIAVETEIGTRLRELCDEIEAPVPFSCRAASCGTCHIEILSGSELLSVAAEDERTVLDALGVDVAPARPVNRLACQAVVESPGLVEIRLPQY
ncbi:MAG: 2Fe-2S iron-sulfur cluster-binding protein [Polyangiaceae bacterium]